jgi:hypothetical protein
MIGARLRLGNIISWRVAHADFSSSQKTATYRTAKQTQNLKLENVVLVAAAPVLYHRAGADRQAGGLTAVLTN